MNETGMKVRQEEKEGQVGSQMDGLQHMLGKLGETIGNLSRRLQPISRECLVEEGGEKKEPEQLVPLATQLRTRRIEVEGIVNQVEDLLDRIEL